VEITAIAHYWLADGQPTIEEIIASYGRVFDLAEKLGVDTVASMSGFDPCRDWAGNLALFGERFTPLAREAERRGLRIALENLMGFGGPLPHLPVNMGGAPATWETMFRLVPSHPL